MAKSPEGPPGRRSDLPESDKRLGQGEIQRCPECRGSGEAKDGQPCRRCSGTGKIYPAGG